MSALKYLLVCDIMAQKFPEKVSFPSTKVESQKCRDVMPLSLVFVAMIAFNNLCLQEVRVVSYSFVYFLSQVGVAFYTVARSLVTIFSLLFTYLILGKKTSCLGKNASLEPVIYTFFQLFFAAALSSAVSSSESTKKAILDLFLSLELLMVSLPLPVSLLTRSSPRKFCQRQSFNGDIKVHMRFRSTRTSGS